MFAIHPQFVDDDLCGDTVLQLVNDLTRPSSFMHPRELYQLRNAALAAARESEVQNTDKEFRIRLELPHFKPEEVRIVSDSNYVTVTAKHEEQADKHGYVKREITRSYKLPKDVDCKSVTSTMNNQNVLSIRALKKAIEAPKDITIPVEFKE